jgi:hypothetical protein
LNISEKSSVDTKVSIIVVTAVLYAVGKAITGYIPTPWGIGQLLIGVFLPIYFAVVSETVPAAIGAGLGTFLGDVLVLTPLGLTNPFLSLVAGVPANFVAAFLLGYFVKRYRTWASFVAATISFVTLGNLIAAVSVVYFVGLPLSLIIGFVVFWNTSAIPAAIIGVPLLLRATKSLYGRSRIVRFFPEWGSASRSTQLSYMIGFTFLFLLIGLFAFALSPQSFLPGWSGLQTYFVVAFLSILIFGPVGGIVAGSRIQEGEGKG